MDTQNFLLDIQGPIATISFNRSTHANALHMDAWQEMKTIFKDLGTRPDVHIIILEGDGKHWCAGIDLALLMNFQQFGQNKDEVAGRQALRDFIINLQSCINAIIDCPQPVIAAIQGACVGAGLDIASACDMRYCTADAFFSIKEIEWAMVADLGSLQRLPAILSPGILNEMAYTGRNVDGREAEKIQLVNQCFAEKQEMKSHITAIAEKICGHAPRAIRGTKEVLQYSRQHSVEESLQYVANYNAAFLSEKDMTEAFMARSEKRPPRYS
jgi:enoyl-CoA hydratase